MRIATLATLVVLATSFRLLGQAPEDEAAKIRRMWDEQRRREEADLAKFKPSTSHAVEKLLDAPMKTPAFFAGEITLKDGIELILDNVRKRGTDVGILVDTKGFHDISTQDSPDVMESRIKFPKYPEILSTRDILRLMLSQLSHADSLEYRATYLVKDGIIWIMPGERAAIKLQQVRGVYKRIPLREVLDDFTNQTGISIVLNDRGNVGAAPITARFVGPAGLQDAVEVVADMASSDDTRLNIRLLDNVIYVTPTKREPALKR